MGGAGGAHAAAQVEAQPSSVCCSARCEAVRSCLRPCWKKAIGPKSVAAWLKNRNGPEVIGGIMPAVVVANIFAVVVKGTGVVGGAGGVGGSVGGGGGPKVGKSPGPIAGIAG